MSWGWWGQGSFYLAVINSFLQAYAYLVFGNWRRLFLTAHMKKLCLKIIIKWKLL